jgi:hypothetical protein
MITSVVTSGTPIAGSWAIDLVTENSTLLLKVTSLDTRQTVNKTVYITGSPTTYVGTLIIGLTIVIAAALTGGNRSIVTVQDAVPASSIAGVSPAGSGAGLIFANSMKIVKIRNASDGAMNGAAGTFVPPVTGIDCRGFNSISFHANQTALGAAGVVETGIMLYSGITDVVADMGKMYSGSSAGILVGGLAFVERKSGVPFGIGLPYVSLRLSTTAANTVTADIWAILSTSGLNRGTVVT